MELTAWQKELMALLGENGMARADIYSVMLVLTDEERAMRMISFLKEAKSPSVDEICEQAGKIAFGENA